MISLWKKDGKDLAIYLIKWGILSLILGSTMGSLSAFFLMSLSWVTQQQTTYSWLLFCLPFGGAIISYLYKRYGGNAVKGNNLVIQQGNGGEEKIPLRMIPLTLIGTLTTHLFGGSAGREGTAVQMGGTAADAIGRLFRLDAIDRKLLIICGISAGFSSVFGTPLAGTIFSIEVLAIGMMRHEALLPSFFSAYFANIVATLWGAHHVHYQMGSTPDLSLSLLPKLCFAGLLFGLTGWLFSHSLSWMKKMYQKWVPNPVLRSFVGGCVIILLVFIVNTRLYLGLSLPLIQQSFSGEVPLFAFLGKLIFTVFTLSAGYQGGEVTPLFGIGAALGSSLSRLLALPASFLSGLGFIGVFAGATNTPVACFIMGIELFGSDSAVYLFLVCVVSYLFSGSSGIYGAQKLGVEKFRHKFPL